MLSSADRKQRKENQSRQVDVLHPEARLGPAATSDLPSATSLLHRVVVEPPHWIRSAQALRSILPKWAAFIQHIGARLFHAPGNHRRAV